MCTLHQTKWDVICCDQQLQSHCKQTLISLDKSKQPMTRLVLNPNQLKQTCENPNEPEDQMKTTESREVEENFFAKAHNEEQSYIFYIFNKIKAEDL